MKMDIIQDVTDSISKKQELLLNNSKGLHGFLRNFKGFQEEVEGVLTDKNKLEKPQIQKLKQFLIIEEKEKMGDRREDSKILI